jgi:hypothetical protein
MNRDARTDARDNGRSRSVVHTLQNRIETHGFDRFFFFMPLQSSLG